MPQEQTAFGAGAPGPEAFRFSPRANRAGEIHWVQWSPEAFQRAADEDKPILLNLTAIWCHWCHVMDETTYSDPGIIELVNANLVPVRVDADQNPHIQDRYLAGGWPTNSFLTPDGDVLLAGTYLPPEAMKSSIRAVLEAWHGDRGRLLERMRRVHCPAPKREGEAREPFAWSEAWQTALRAVERAYDAVHGGFGRAPKFPAFEAVELLLSAYFLDGDRRRLEMALHTLRAMAQGEMRDRVEGGFFRYATRRDWSAPHYEKMLAGNAGMIENLVTAWKATGEEWPADLIRETIDYILKTLSAGESGGFFGSQDADESYYRADGGERLNMKAPLVDDTIHCDWNGMICRSLIAAGMCLGRGDWVEAALRTLRFCAEQMMCDNGALRHFFRRGEPGGPTGLLADQCEMGRAFLSAYEAVGDSLFLSQAKRLATFMTGSLEDPEEGAFYATPEEPGALGLLRQREKPFEANVSAARFLWRLSAHLGDDRYTREASRCLEWFAGEAKTWGHLGAGYGLAALEVFGRPTRLAVVTKGRDSAGLLQAGWQAHTPALVIHLLDPEEELEWGAEAFPAEPAPAAYVCVGTECRGPATSVDELNRTLDVGAQNQT